MKVEDEAGYDCPSCGEDIRVPVDASAGRDQEYIEDCPVCCCPIVLRVSLDDDGAVHVEAQRE